MVDVSPLHALAEEEALAEGDSAFAGPVVPPRVVQRQEAPSVPPTQTQNLILSTFGPEGERALKVAYCESGNDLYAAPEENPGHRGIFQLGEVHAPRFSRHGWDWDTDGLIPERNIAVAYEIQQEQGWWPWRFSAFCHGVY